MSLTVVCFKWKSEPGYRSTFGPEAVNALQEMVARHYQAPHRFVCVTDDAAGIDASIEIVPLWSDHAQLPSPHGGKNPSCYRRLKLFDPAIVDILGRRFVSIDLDAVITGDLTPLWDRPEAFVIWGDYVNPTTPYNGSMMLMSAGARPQVWTEFEPTRSPREAKGSGCFGSDQGWISYKLGPNEARWRREDGVYSYRVHIAPAHGALPADARIVFFHGAVDPWSPKAQSLGWVRQHYPMRAAA